jgi:hypothetical protein
MIRPSITDIDLGRLGSLYIITVKAEAEGRMQIAVEVVDFETLKTDTAKSTAIRDASEKAKARVISALTNDLLLNLPEPTFDFDLDFEKSPPSNVTSIHQHTWRCDYNKKIKILNLWNKAKSLGYTEHELRQVLLGYNVSSRKELDNQQADELISFLAGAINTAIGNQKGAG